MLIASSGFFKLNIYTTALFVYNKLLYININIPLLHTNFTSSYIYITYNLKIIIKYILKLI